MPGLSTQLSGFDHLQGPGRHFKPSRVRLTILGEAFKIVLNTRRDGGVVCTWSARYFYRLLSAAGLQVKGQILRTLQDPSPTSYAPITSVLQVGGYLYLGSLERDAMARLPL